MPDLDILGLEVENTIVKIEISALEFVLLQSLVQKQKSLNLGPKMPYLVMFGLECQNNIVTFEISALEFVHLQNIVKE